MNKIWKTLAIGAVVAMLVLPRMAAADVKFGIKGGVNVANVNGNFADNVTNWKSRVGFCAGIFLEFNLGRILTIQPEVLYTMKGAEATLAEGVLTGTGKLRFDYLEIPILLKVRIPTGDVHPFIFAGPAIGFNLKAAFQDITGSSSDVAGMNKVDYSAVFGGGLQLGRSIHIDARYTLGLQKLEVPDLGTIDLKNGVLSATIGLAF
ncbi:MAG: porin family protein [Candidatus Aminicenantales bacterium]